MQSPPNPKNPEKVLSHFAQIAADYDRNNTLLSLGLHHLWNRSLVRAIRSYAKGGLLLDLCAGTGTIAFTYLAQARDPERVALLDFSTEMLNIARERARKNQLAHHEITYLLADAAKIPLNPASSRVITTAYGLRNLADPIACAEEVKRVLEPGGVWAILELTRPKGRIRQWGHAQYLKRVLPLIGKFFSTDPEAYTYLGKSILAFPSPQEIAEQLSTVGLKPLRIHSLASGAASLFLFQKPLTSVHHV